MGNITFSKDELDIINSVNDPKIKGDVIKEFLHAKTTMFQTNAEIHKMDLEASKIKSENIKSLGTKALDFLTNIVNNIAENSDKIIDVIDYAKTVKDDYDRKYHPEKIEQNEDSNSESQDLE